jgi:tRNA-dihydrouridine synthase
MTEKTTKSYDFLFCVAPMMDWTDRHCRVFHRLMTRRARLYTEMLTTGAIIHGDRRRLLGFDPSEHPVALQLGGSDPRDLATAAKIGEDFGYDEINLNVGCPSDRVTDGRFGACLMAEPALVAAGVEAMKREVNIRKRRWMHLRAASSPPAPMRWSSMPAKPGSTDCRRGKIATSRRSITTGSIG